MSIYQNLALVTLFYETSEHHSDLRAALQGAGYTQNTHEAGQKLADQAFELLARLAAPDHQNDRSAAHLVHAASGEVEMWLQTVAARARRAGFEQPDLLVGAHLHGHDHAISVMAQARRALGVLRSDEALRRSLGSERSVQDLMLRGHTLLAKLERCANDAVHPDGSDAKDKTQAQSAELERWLKSAHQAAERAFVGQARAFGMLGVVPMGAAPLGGAAGAVTLHAQAQRPGALPVRAPDPAGWSVGRQGRNRENPKNGYV